MLRKIHKTNAKVSHEIHRETERGRTKARERNAPGIVVIFNQFTEQIFYQHIFRDNRRMFVLKIFKYLHCENNDDDDKEASLEETARCNRWLR